MDRGGYYPGCSLPQPPPAPYHNEQPPPNNYFFRGPPPPSMQQPPPDMHYQPPATGYFPNDPHYLWQQQNSVWAAQMQAFHAQSQHSSMQHLQQQQQGHHAPPAHYLPPPPPPPPSLLGAPTLHPPPPPPNLREILGDMFVDEVFINDEEDVKPPVRKREKQEPATPSSASSQASPAKSAAGAAAAAAASTITLSSSTTSSSRESMTSIRSEMSQASPSLTSAVPSHLPIASGLAASIPSLLDGLRADVAAREERERGGRGGSQPDLRSIEHAASILSIRTGKSPREVKKRGRSRDERGRGRRREEERSDSRKENRAEPSERDRRREDRTKEGEKRDERRRDGDRERERDKGRPRERSSQRTRSPHASSTSTTQRRRRDDERTDDRPSRGRNGERRGSRRNGESRREREREEEEWVEKEPSSKDPAGKEQQLQPLRPSDIQLNVREGAREEGGVQVYLHSEEDEDEEEDGEREGEDEYEEGEGEDEEEVEEARESDMDIETEADDPAAAAPDPASFLAQLQQQQERSGSRLHDHPGDSSWGSGCAPEDEEENRMTPPAFFASGPSRRVNSPLFREKYNRARALASRALSDEYRERYDLISKHLRSRCIFRGLQSSCGPDAPKLTINDPRPRSKHVQTFPSKESNVQYHGPDSFVSEGYGKKSAAMTKSASYASVATASRFSYVSQTKLVRAKAPPAAAAVSPRPAPTTLKRTIQNGPAPAAAASTLTTTAASSSTSSVASTQSTSSTTATTSVVAAEAAAAASSSDDDPTPPKRQKLSRVDELLACLSVSQTALPSSSSAGVEQTASTLRKAPSEPAVAAAAAPAASTMAAVTAAAKAAAVVARSEETPRVSAALAAFAAAHSPRAERVATAAAAGAKPHAAASPRPALPPRSALSFRKIGEHVVRPGSKLCFEWAESGGCSAGVFCHFEHGEGAERVEKAVCSRMLRGLCRGDANCPLPHGLLPHQMPICEHYLRMQCNHGADECGLVHIKHNEKVPVCAFFNQGKCKKEDDCTFRHQYRSDVVRALGVHAPPAARASQPSLQRNASTAAPPGGFRSSRLPKGRALLTAAAAPAAARSPQRAAAAAAAAPDTSTFDWIE